VACSNIYLCLTSGGKIFVFILVKLNDDRENGIEGGCVVFLEFDFQLMEGAWWGQFMWGRIIMHPYTLIWGANVGTIHELALRVVLVCVGRSRNVVRMVW